MNRAFSPHAINYGFDSSVGLNQTRKNRYLQMPCWLLAIENFVSRIFIWSGKRVAPWLEDFKFYIFIRHVSSARRQQKTIRSSNQAATSTLLSGENPLHYPLNEQRQARKLWIPILKSSKANSFTSFHFGKFTLYSVVVAIFMNLKFIPKVMFLWIYVESIWCFIMAK